MPSVELLQELKVRQSRKQSIWSGESTLGVQFGANFQSRRREYYKLSDVCQFWGRRVGSQNIHFHIGLGESQSLQTVEKRRATESDRRDRFENGRLRLPDDHCNVIDTQKFRHPNWVLRHRQFRDQAVARLLKNGSNVRRVSFNYLLMYHTFSKFARVKPVFELVSFPRQQSSTRHPSMSN